MIKTLSLILPVLIPSWRFFKAIEPSPRVQWAVIPNNADIVQDWQEFRPRPQHITLVQMLGRLFWNPVWNDSLFVVTCCERIAQQPTPHSITEIQRRIVSDMDQIQIDVSDKQIQFRLVFVQRSGAGLTQEVIFVSDRFPASGPIAQ